MTPPRMLGIAAALGLVHATASLGWALGGTWLLDTVGPWAVELKQDAPVLAVVMLLVVTVGKAAVAVGPLLTARSPRWRALWWLAGAVLALYGVLNAAGAWLVISGLAGDRDAADPAALWGHAALWDPLFALWGIALLLGLRATRPTAAVTHAPTG